MNVLDHVVTDNLKTNKDQINEVINNDTTFDNSDFNLYRGTSNPLSIVTVSLRRGKKHIATTVYGLTFLWGSGANNSIINRKHTKHYERTM